jgi:hypothetical protein
MSRAEDLGDPLINSFGRQQWVGSIEGGDVSEIVEIIEKQFVLSREGSKVYAIALHEGAV